MWMLARRPTARGTSRATTAAVRAAAAWSAAATASAMAAPPASTGTQAVAEPAAHTGPCVRVQSVILTSMPRFIGHVSDLDPQVNSCYFVHIAGHHATTYYNFTRRTSRSPPEDIGPIPIFMADHRDYRTAELGYLIEGNLRLECVWNARGAYRCSDQDRLYNKITYLKPKTLNPMVLESFLPSGTIVASPVYSNPRPDREIKIPINMIEVTCMSEPIIPRPLLDAQPRFHPPPTQPPPQAENQTLPFQIYLDSLSQAATLPLPASSTVHSGNLENIATDLENILEDDSAFAPPVTSTRTPEGNKPGPSGLRRRRSSVILAEAEHDIVDIIRKGSKTPVKKARKSPRKTPRKSPAKLRKTPSQPAITEFATKPSKRPWNHDATVPVPAKRIKRILSDLNPEEYAKARFLMDDIERSDPCIKEATLSLDLDLDKIQIGQYSQQRMEDNVFQDQNIQVDQDASTLPLDNLAPDLHQVQPFNPEVRITAHRQAPTFPVLPQIQDDDHMVFNVANALVAEANLDHAARPRRGPPTPEHVLLVIEDVDTITHVLNFYQPHDPMDIIEAFYNHSLNTSVDEGFDTTATTGPQPPPPLTPSSSTEAVAGSPPQVSAIRSDTTLEEVSAVQPILKDDDVYVISDDETSFDEHNAKVEKEEEGGKEKEGHAN